ncbi:MAG: type II secretion system protein N [Rhodoferax sp.]|nr:type II secretion system protein N [Rhodoferax sp.]
MARIPSPANRTPWAWAWGGVLVGLLLASLMFAPARWLAGVVNQRSEGRVLLDDARGTVWDGSAVLSLAGGAGSLDAATLPSRLGWQLQLTWTGLQLRMTAPCCIAQAWAWQLRPQWGGATLSLSDTPSVWPAQLLSGLGTPFNTLAFQGPLALNTTGFSVAWLAGRMQVKGGLRLDAQSLSSRLSTVSPMGSYRLAVAGGATPSLQLDTLSGPLQLSGRGQWVGGKLQFNGEATSAAENQAALSNLLNIIGRRDGARSVITLG